MRRVVLPAIVCVLMAGAAVAQEAASPLIDLLACRIDETRVRLSFKFESSPCWETAEPVIGEGSGEPAGASVAIGTVATAEVCAMSIVIDEVDAELPVAVPVNALDLTLTAPDGALLAATTVAVAEPSAECAAPANETAVAQR